ncbi:hypothetical protein LTR66_013252 [Elasticomyces elasticus]|nr:hypothetical protein LTR66_013252 [Elasticomyces elasticus]KAK4969267.1 hypothetical protein LTR28_001174 [Elasticomyces elasticus]
MGPTSSAFTFGVAKSSLRRMGIQSDPDPVDNGPGSYLTTPTRTPAPSHDVLHTWDPLHTIPRAEAIRLIETYEEESGSIYPFLDIELLTKSAHCFYDGTNDVRESLSARGSRLENTLSGGVNDILKLVIAIALIIEGRGPTSLSTKLLDSVESGFDGRPCGPSVDMLEIQAWTLMTDFTSYLLRTMIAYGHIGSRVWEATSNPSKLGKKEETAYLDFKVREWQNTITPEYRLHHGGDDMLKGHTRTENRIRILLYLRVNQMRLLIYRRSLLSPTTIMENPSDAQLVVDIAKDTIRLLDKLNRLSDIYSSRQTCFNYFLVSALTVLFLAVCHAPAQFNESCREEFFLALDLVRGFSARSYVAGKLWKTIKHLKVIGPKLGIFPNQEQQGRRWNDTQLGAGPCQPQPSGQNTLALQQELGFDYMNAKPFEPMISPSNGGLLDGSQLSYELTNLFEAIEPRYDELPLQSLGNHRGFDLYDYSSAEDLSRSLLDSF